MSDNKHVYCRLCAELKPDYKQIDLQTEDGLCQEIVNKLTRFNVQLNLNDNVLQKTVCYSCVNSLQRSFEFISAVESAQSTLNDFILMRQIKKEESVSDDEKNTNESTTHYEISIENIKIEVKRDSSSSEKNTENPTEKKRSKNMRQIKKEENISAFNDESSTYKSLASYQNDIEYKKIKSVKGASTSKSCLKKKSNKTSGTKKNKNVCISSDALPLSHLKTLWKDYDWRCAFCETQFPTLDELQSHSMQYHNTCNPYSCTDCKSRKLRLDNFIMHVRMHRKYLKYSCYKCYMNFCTIKERTIHMAEHTLSEHVCCGCNASFKTQEELAQHTSVYYRLRKSREPVIRVKCDSLVCTICEKMFKNRKCLLAHMSLHQNANKDHMCEICGKCFVLRANLTEHYNKHSDVKPYQCEICKTWFKTLRGFRLHAGSHDGEKPFSCDKCEKCFRLKSQLATHTLTHSDSLPHVCTYCNKSFRLKSALNRHLVLHTGAKRYSCTICQRNFTYWQNYNVHMKRIHGTNMAKRKRTPFGTFPVDPATGEVVYPDTDKILEWKKSTPGKKDKE